MLLARRLEQKWSPFLAPYFLGSQMMPREATPARAYELCIKAPLEGGPWSTSTSNWSLPLPYFTSILSREVTIFGFLSVSIFNYKLCWPIFYRSRKYNPQNLVTYWGSPKTDICLSHMQNGRRGLCILFLLRESGCRSGFKCWHWHLHKTQIHRD